MSTVGPWPWLEEMAEMIFLSCVGSQVILVAGYKLLGRMSAEQTSRWLYSEQQQTHGMRAGVGVVRHG